MRCIGILIVVFGEKASESVAEVVSRRSGELSSSREKDDSDSDTKRLPFVPERILPVKR